MFKFLLRFSYVAFVMVVIFTGCSNESQTETIEELQTQLSEQENCVAQLTRDNQALRASIQQLQRPQTFSYIEQLDEEARGHYQTFLKTKDLTHFESFTSDEMFVMFLHSVVTREDNVSTAILYNDGSFVDVNDLKPITKKKSFVTISRQR